jgi:5-methylcytosine-specific restriction enzyme B
MTEKLADKIRYHVNENYIEPARKSHNTEVIVKALDVHNDMNLTNRMPAVCGAIDMAFFEREYNVQLISRSGPKQGSTVSWKFKIDF